MVCVDGSGFTDRGSKEYLDWLENQYMDKRQQQISVDEHLLKSLVNRLDRLESAQPLIKAEGGQSQQANPSPSDMAKLTLSIDHLSLSVIHDQPQNPGNELRPEYWVQVVAKGLNIKQMSMNNLHSEELLFGMMSVYKYLLGSKGDSNGYLKHMMFLGRHVMERNFNVLACCKYDKYMVDRVLCGKTTFKEFDSVAAGLFLHGGAVQRSEFQRPSDPATTTESAIFSVQATTTARV